MVHVFPHPLAPYAKQVCKNQTNFLLVVTALNLQFELADTDLLVMDGIVQQVELAHLLKSNSRVQEVEFAHINL